MQRNAFASYEASKESRPAFLTEQRQSKSRLQWWYRFSLFPEPPASATLEELEFFRRGQTNSQILFVLSIVECLPMPVAFYIGLKQGAVGFVLFAIMVIGLVLLLAAALLNRARQVTLSALIPIAVYIGGVGFELLFTPGGVTHSEIPALHILVFSIAIGASTLPRKLVPLVTLVNVAVIISALTIFPQAPVSAGGIPRAEVFLQAPAPIMGQIFITIVSLLWASGISRSLKRANRAEELARLEYDLAQRAVQDKERGNRLEESVQQITEVHRRVANGDLSARVPLTDRNILWQISGLLNNLLTRFQSMGQRSQEQERVNALLRRENERLLQALNMRRQDSSDLMRRSDSSDFSNRATPGNRTPSYFESGPRPFRSYER